MVADARLEGENIKWKFQIIQDHLRGGSYLFKLN